MMMREIMPVNGPLNVNARVPGSKSFTNRALVCAALAQGESSLLNASESDDTALMANALNQFGVLARRKEGALLVEGTGGRLFAPKFPIPVGNAGTTLRFLLSLSALAQGRTVLDASSRMAERPNNDLLHALAQLGVSAQQFGPRFVVEGGSLAGGPVSMNAQKSSQFVSSMLMTSPYARGDVIIRLNGERASEPYIAITLAVMERFGVQVDKLSPDRFLVRSGQRYRPSEFSVEADASGASYFLAAAAISGGSVVVGGMKRDSLQGDAKFVGALQSMGCRVEYRSDGVEVVRTGALHGIEVAMNSMPDVVPTLAVVALFADSPTRMTNVAHLRYKESDRLSALETELRKLGANILATEDTLTVMPAPLHGALLDSYDDHRLAMCFSLAGLKIPGVKIGNPDCVTKSFPTFWKEFENITLTT